MTSNSEPADSPQLVGSIDSSGVAQLSVQNGGGRDKDVATINASLKPNLETSGDDWTALTSSGGSEVEDYDAMKLDPNVVVDGSAGAGAELERAIQKRHSMQDSTSSDSGFEKAHFSPITRRSPLDTSTSRGRRKSIPITLERTGKKGRYILTADDPEIRDILKASVEREQAAAADKKPRKSFRDLVFTRQFTTFDRQNPLSSQSPFHGFFTLFWLGMGLLLVRIAAQNWKTHGSVFGSAEILHMMVERDLVLLGITDGVMCAATASGLLLQKLILKKYISWNRTGWIIQNLWQALYLFGVIGWTLYRKWPWTHTVFIVLHGLVFVMKQHSYAFYNGYLSQVYRRKAILEQKLQQLDDMEPIASPTSPRRESIPSTALDRAGTNTTLKRRRSTGSKTRTSTNLTAESSIISEIARAIESNSALDAEQMRAFSRIIRTEIRSLDDELKGKCTQTENFYPNNLTLTNWADWVCLPTLVYELEYPRQERINWWYVAEKTCATFGVIWVMMVISQAYIYPSVAATIAMKEAGMPLPQRWREFPWVLSDMLFPLLLEQLLSWYVIWECCLNVLAELTRFADRGFYGDWWNSVSWDQYARDWNRPVHNFLLRHVYHSSISAFHLSKQTATLVTFLLSALVHELIMWCLFRKLRGYLFTMQLVQLPMIWLSRTSVLRGRDLLGNLVFWFGLFVGPSLITSLYLIV